MQKKIKLLWSGGRTGAINYGDVLSRDIVEAFTGCKVSYGDATNADIAAIGSILNKIAKRSWVRPIRLKRKLLIWGSGAINNELKTPRHCEFLAVRGPKTHSQLLLKNQEMTYGDPALLIPLIHRPRSKPKNQFCIIPHVSDFKLNAPEKLKSSLPNSTVLDLSNPDINYVTNEICNSEIILSSSLHGLIVADAFNLPRLRIKFSDSIVGGDFKYFDYFESINSPNNYALPFNLVTKNLVFDNCSEANPETIKAIQNSLIKVIKDQF